MPLCRVYYESWTVHNGFRIQLSNQSDFETLVLYKEDLHRHAGDCTTLFHVHIVDSLVMVTLRLFSLGFPSLSEIPYLGSYILFTLDFLFISIREVHRYLGCP